MAFGTGIDYADATFSPWIGCTKVSPGCANCYAEGVGKRMGIEWGPQAQRRFMPDKYWEQPLAWNRKAKKLGKRYRVFVSLCDPFEHDEQHPDCERTENEIVRLCHMIEQTPSLDWLLLTKRPANIPASVPVGWYRDGFPINLWLGVTAEDQPRADERISLLLQVRAAVRWLSYEPGLGAVSIDKWTHIYSDGSPMCGHCCNKYPQDGPCDCFYRKDCPHCKGTGRRPGSLDWLVIGCESGPRARLFNPDWADSVVEQCKAAGVPCFTKQLPEHRDGTGRLRKSAELAKQGWPVQYPEPRS